MSVSSRYRDLAPVRLYDAMNRRDWEAVAKLVAPDIRCELVLSREIVRGRDAFIAFNTEYPGAWDIAIDQADGDEIVLRISVTIDGQVEQAIVFFEMRDGVIVRLSEWWPEYYRPPAWRGDRFQHVGDH